MHYVVMGVCAFGFILFVRVGRFLLVSFNKVLPICLLTLSCLRVGF